MRCSGEEEQEEGKRGAGAEVLPHICGWPGGRRARVSGEAPAARRYTRRQRAPSDGHIADAGLPSALLFRTALLCVCWQCWRRAALGRGASMRPGGGSVVLHRGARRSSAQQQSRTERGAEAEKSCLVRPLAACTSANGARRKAIKVPQSAPSFSACHLGTPQGVSRTRSLSACLSRLRPETPQPLYLAPPHAMASARPLLLRLPERQRTRHAEGGRTISSFRGLWRLVCSCLCSACLPPRPCAASCETVGIEALLRPNAALVRPHALAVRATRGAEPEGHSSALAAQSRPRRSVPAGVVMRAEAEWCQGALSALFPCVGSATCCLKREARRQASLVGRERLRPGPSETTLLIQSKADTPMQIRHGSALPRAARAAHGRRRRPHTCKGSACCP
jgi:hypothetical protein